jgi:hypothetical protein
VWTVVPAGGGIANSAQLDAVATVNISDAWAVGFAAGAGTSPLQALIERWDGTRWAPVPAPARPSGTDSRLHGIVAVSASDVWAVGSQTTHTRTHSLIEHWNGSAWSVVASPRGEPAGAELLAVTSAGTGGLWAVGDVNIGGSFTQLVEHWDGVRWKTVAGAPVGPTGHDFLSAVAAAGPADVWAVGRLGRHSVPVIEHWDGTRWKQVPQPVSGYDSSLSGVAVVGTSDVWAVGSQNLTQTVTEHWDGLAWQLVPSPSPAGGNTQNGLQGIAVLARGDVWAVGATLSGGAQRTTLTEHWDGRSWTLVPSPNPGSRQDALTAFAGTAADQPLWAVGYQDHGSGEQALILRAAG